MNNKVVKLTGVYCLYHFKVLSTNVSNTSLLLEKVFIRSDWMLRRKGFDKTTLSAQEIFKYH